MSRYITIADRIVLAGATYYGIGRPAGRSIAGSRIVHPGAGSERTTTPLPESYFVLHIHCHPDRAFLQDLSLGKLIRELKLENENGPAKLEHQPGLRTKQKATLSDCLSAFSSMLLPGTKNRISIQKRRSA
jgi:hypothetical protein